MKGSLGWVALAALLVLWGCFDEDLGTEYRNQLPETELSSAPPQGSRGSFSVRMNWYGTDHDGEIVGYYFSWDDTVEWHFTPSSESTFVVSADNCLICGHTDTLYTDQHTFWIKAVDDRGGQDPTPEHRTFTAESTAPITEITRGCSETCPETGTNVLFEWSAYDPDGGEIDSFFYSFKNPALELIDYNTWRKVGADCVYVREADLPTGINNFAVVAKDNAGALERVLERGRNWCCFEPVLGTDAEVTIYGGILGRRNNKRPGGVEHLGNVSELFRGAEISFSWDADASEYGGIVIGYRFAQEDTTEWNTWYINNTMYPEDGGTFVPSVGNHVFYVQALDDIGTVSLCYFKYYVEAGPLVPPTEALLLIDDSQYSGFASSWGWDDDEADRQEGEFFTRMLEGYDYLEWDCQRQGKAPPVSLVGRYRSVIWYMDDYDEEMSRTRLYQIFRQGTRYLDSYAKVGGNLVMIGLNPAWALDDECQPGDDQYPFKYASTCGSGQSVPISYSVFGLGELNISPDDVFRGGIPTDPARFPNLPLGDHWPGYQYEDTSYLFLVEAFSAAGINAAVNAVPTYYFDYAEGQGLPGEYCSLIVDNSGVEELGSSAYFGWPLFWCNWDSVGVFMREFLTSLCNEPPVSP